MFNGLNPLQVIIRKKTMVTQVAAVLPFTSVSPIAPQNYSKYKNRFKKTRNVSGRIFRPFSYPDSGLISEKNMTQALVQNRLENLKLKNTFCSCLLWDNEKTKKL